MLRGFRALSARDRRRLLRALIEAVRVRWLIRRRPFHDWQGRAARPLRVPPVGPVEPGLEEQDRVVWATLAACRRVPGAATCLVEAIVAQRLLADEGWASTVHVGVAPDERGAGIEAHAWLEADGRVLVGQVPGGSVDERFRRIHAIETPGVAG